MNTVKSLSAHKSLFSILVCTAILAWISTSFGEVLYLDDFEDGKLMANMNSRTMMGIG